jgi:hypothetical protein
MSAPAKKAKETKAPPSASEVARVRGLAADLARAHGVTEGAILRVLTANLTPETEGWGVLEWTDAMRARHVQGSTPPKGFDAVPPRTVAVRRLNEAWKEHADARGTGARRKTRYELPLSALLLLALTIDADEGPALDLLGAIFETVDGWLRRAGDTDLIGVSVGEVMLLARRVDVAAELVRCGAVFLDKEASK